MGTVLLAGASGGTGRETLARLTATGHRVRALTRTDAKVDRLERAGADGVVVGDLLDEADAERAVEGADAVVTCVGSSPVEVLDRAVRGGELVDGRGNANLVEAATEAGVERFVMQSSLGVGDDRASLMAWSFRLLVAALHTPDAADRTLEVVWNPLLADRATADSADIDWQHRERKP